MSQEQNNEKILSSVDEAIEDIRAGKVVIVVDDEDRENEGDFIVAGEKITPEIVNFMLHNGRGVLCAPLTEDRCRELDLEMQVANNTSLLGTPFTVSVDLLGHGCTTGVAGPTARLRCGRWSILPPRRPIWAVRGIFSRSGRVTKGCSAVRVIPKR